VRIILFAGALAAVLAGVGVFVLTRSETQDGAPILSEGDVAPDFNLPAVDGRTVSLSDFIGDKNVLLYFSMGYG
jgi:cytochrome oxidase Cu insertion factor (SCO1/SenC/PrrC family)